METKKHSESFKAHVLMYPLPPLITIVPLLPHYFSLNFLSRSYKLSSFIIKKSIYYLITLLHMSKFHMDPRIIYKNGSIKAKLKERLQSFLYNCMQTNFKTWIKTKVKNLQKPKGEFTRWIPKARWEVCSRTSLTPNALPSTVFS